MKIQFPGVKKPGNVAQARKSKFVPSDEEIGAPASDPDEVEEDVQPAKPKAPAMPKPKLKAAAPKVEEEEEEEEEDLKEVDTPSHSSGEDEGSTDDWFAEGDVVDEWEQEQEREYARRRRNMFFPKDEDKVILLTERFDAAFRVHTLKKNGKIETVTCTRNRPSGCAYCDVAGANKCVSASAIRYVYRICHLRPFETSKGEKRAGSYKTWLTASKVHQTLMRLISRTKAITTRVLTLDITGKAPQLNYSIIPEEMDKATLKAFKSIPVPEDPHSWKKSFAPETIKEQKARLRAFTYSADADEELDPEGQEASDIYV